MGYGFKLVYERFRKQSLPNFEGKPDPMVVEEWLKSIEAIFDHMELDDRQRVFCAAHLLKMDAKIWWDVVKKTRDLNTMTWANFIQVFNKKYYSATILETKVDEFVTLMQGNLFDIEYAQNVYRLARFTPEIVPTEAMKVQSFVRGLQPMIARDVKMTSVEVVSYAEILDKALGVEYLDVMTQLF
ncbi:uncharacterized protein LOC133799614 [Humulus lupulus]|uniref:uncharacterized protein LOC133799614 n=1 Tax=Humulus lupulus TaxID=3486 RepID=UPI002B408716|nr:uncharacterized protein LOC133799614 [Humulus lupulus]